ncbi:hypothetical protein [Empedobacter tilapiae]|uniref:Uncharacterized protein n=1 Tax=Empedobacter tilapiae TaxID=2491114 RepID=A0A4Z1BLY2_9FLAO|nr:hypothetical protein [Empedobacter tilapiae]TGN26760.1 hypothetical protein E4J94_09955 [Empedobacter tilapiae]
MANIENQQQEQIYTEKSTLKNWFRSKLKPTQAQFWAWMDSYWHKGEKMPISTIDGLGEAVDGKAPIVHYHDQYATNDATSLSNENVEQWKKKLDVDNLQFDDQAISLTNEYVDFGLTNVSKQAQFNQAIYESNASKLKEPTNEGDSKEYPYLVGIDEEGYSAKIQSGDIGKNFANTDLVVTTNRKHTGPASVELAMSFICSNSSVRYSGIVDKSADATFNIFPVLDSSGNLAKSTNAINAMIATMKIATPAQKVAFMKEMNGQYSSGQITTTMILMPVVAIGDNTEGLSKIDIYGTELNIDPDTSYVRIKELGNVTNWQDCAWQSIDSTRLEVYIDNSFIDVNKSYVFELKHGIQVHTTTVSLDVVSNLTDIDLSTLIYTQTKDNVPDNYINVTVDATGFITHTVKNSANPANLDGQILKKIKTQPIANYDDNLILIIDFNWSYPTKGYEFPVQYDFMGLSKVIEYPENDVSNNIVAGVGTGFQSNINSNMRTRIIGGGFIPKSGIGQAIIIKKGSVLTTVLIMGGTIIRYTSNATITSEYAVEFNFVGRYLDPKQVGTYKISSIQKF